MKQLIIPDKVQKDMLTDFIIMGENRERYKKLEDSNQILNEHNRILSALSKDYTTVLLCDLRQDTFEVVKEDTFTRNDHEENQKLVCESNCYSERIRFFSIMSLSKNLLRSFWKDFCRKIL